MWGATMPGYAGFQAQPMQYSYPQYDQGNAGAVGDDASSEWAFLDLVDPPSLSVSRDLKLIKSVSKQFARATVLKVGSPSRMEKLLQILQLVIRVISKESSNRKEKIRNLQQKLQSRGRCVEQRSPTVKTVKVVACRCPVCQLGFKSLPFLDAHVFSKHQDVAALWQAIRTPQPPGAYAFPWTKSYSMHASMLPPNSGTVQLFNEATVQQMFDEFKKRYENERRNSEQQTHTMIKREMEKFTAKMEDLQSKARFGSSEQYAQPSRAPNVQQQRTAPAGVARRPPVIQPDEEDVIGTVPLMSHPMSMRQMSLDIPPQRMEPPLSPIERPVRPLQKDAASSPMKPATPQKVLSSSEKRRSSRSGSSISYSSGKVLQPKQQTPAPAIDVPAVSTPTRSGSRPVALESFLSEQMEEEERHQEEQHKKPEPFESSLTAGNSSLSQHSSAAPERGHLVTNFIEEEEHTDNGQIEEEDHHSGVKQPQRDDFFDDFGSYSDLYHAEPPPGGSRLRNSDSFTGMQAQPGSYSDGSAHFPAGVHKTTSSLNESDANNKQTLGVARIKSSTPSSNGSHSRTPYDTSGSMPLTDDQKGNTPDLTVRRRPTLQSSEALFVTDNGTPMSRRAGTPNKSFETDSGRGIGTPKAQSPIQSSPESFEDQPPLSPPDKNPPKLDFDGFDVDDIDLSGL